MGVYEAQVVSHKKINSNTVLLELQCPEVVEKALPGQFIHLECSRTNSPLLRRPFSIHDVDYDKGILRIFYAIVGKGTELLSKVLVDEKLSVMGPLGKGFQLPTGKKVTLLGGGMGIAPLLFLAKELYKKDNEITILLGARNKEGLQLKDSFTKFSHTLQLATDDGSLGLKGNVLDLLQGSLTDSLTSDIFYACGPTPMLKALQEISQKEDIPCQISLEERMACGIGACLGCTCKGKDKTYYPKVCSDGPVFWAEEVDFDE